MSLPDNDNIANAIFIDDNNIYAYGVNMGATKEVGEPDAYLSGGNDHSLWYVFHPTVAGDIGFSIQGFLIEPNFSPTLTVYSSPGAADYSVLTKITESAVLLSRTTMWRSMLIPP